MKKKLLHIIFVVSSLFITGNLFAQSAVFSSESLMLHYSFDSESIIEESKKVLDNSSYANTGFYSGIELIETGFLNEAMLFSESDSSVKLSEGLGFLKNYTISLWLKRLKLGPVLMVFSAGDNGAQYFGLHNLGEGKVIVSYRDNFNNQLTCYSDKAISDNMWHHLAITGETNGSIKIYIDGVEDPTNNCKQPVDVGGFNPNNSTLNIIGKHLSDNYNFMGYIDEFTVFNKALSQEDITTIYNDYVNPAIPEDIVDAPHPAEDPVEEEEKDLIVAEDPFGDFDKDGKPNAFDPCPWDPLNLCVHEDPEEPVVGEAVPEVKEEPPVKENPPVDNEEPVVQEEPPAEKEEPAVKEEPSIEKEKPVIQEEPTAQEEPVVEEQKTDIEQNNQVVETTNEPIPVAPNDRDGDGIPDEEDLCDDIPYSAEDEENKPTSKKGCPPEDIAPVDPSTLDWCKNFPAWQTVEGCLPAPSVPIVSAPGSTVPPLNTHRTPVDGNNSTELPTWVAGGGGGGGFGLEGCAFMLIPGGNSFTELIILALGMLPIVLRRKKF